jgi:ParB family chromosome partitioning protein
MVGELRDREIAGHRHQRWNQEGIPMPRKKDSKQPRIYREPTSDSDNVVNNEKPELTRDSSSSDVKDPKDTHGSKKGDTAAGSRSAKGRNHQKKPAANSTRTPVEMTMLPVSSLRPNSWNPNTLSEIDQTELGVEVRRNGRTSKTILVRPLKHATYEIVDGEHNWQAAKDAGHVQVPCEVAHLDDFEAMRLTYVRNLQGNRDPLRTGRLFQRMLELRGMSLDGPANSQRTFARENNINETTLRNYLLYAQAAEVRHRYAPETAEESIRGLSVAKIRKYLELPDDRRDEWLDRGASNEEAEAILAETSGKPNRSKKPAQAHAPASTAGTSGTVVLPAVEMSDEEADKEVELSEAERNNDKETQPDRNPVTNDRDQPASPLTPAEQHIVSNVVGTFRDGRAAVREKILGGLGAFPDAVAFFRRMIKGGM